MLYIKCFTSGGNYLDYLIEGGQYPKQTSDFDDASSMTSGLEIISSQ